MQIGRISHRAHHRAQGELAILMDPVSTLTPSRRSDESRHASPWKLVDGALPKENRPRCCHYSFHREAPLATSNANHPVSPLSFIGNVLIERAGSVLTSWSRHVTSAIYYSLGALTYNIL
jgi:hypothetical protein